MDQKISAGVVLLLAVVLFLPGCSKDEGTPPPTTGRLQGTITDGSSASAIFGVRAVVYDANTNQPVATLWTSAAGVFGVELLAGTYYVRCSRQGYEDTPPRDISPFPLNVAVDQTTATTIQMYASANVNTGAISGGVTSAGKGLPNVLVVAQSGPNGYSSVTDAAGGYAIYNIPASQCSVRAWTSGLSSTQATLSVTAGTEVSNVNLVLSSGTTGTVNGSITFLATTNIEVDVALLSPLSHEVIPGLSATTVSTNFTISNVPLGTYLARATFRNDGKVVDPDWIVKNGEPMVVVTGGTISRPFSVTGAISLLSPTNPASSTQPIEVSGPRPTLTWEAYSSADHYVPEVINQSGKVIWGGFSNNWTVRRVLIPKTQTSIQFDSDSSATESLVPGKTYRWKVYVSKDDAKEPTGWKLISVSEDQRGLIKILP